MDINDPTAVKALLDRLGASRAWQDALGESSQNTSGHARSPETVLQPEPSVASLLSQLRASESVSNTPPVPSRPAQDLPPVSQDHPTPLPAPSTRAQDLRSLSFQQALSHLTRLASDPDFLAAVSRLRQEQNELEQLLWEERQAIHKKHKEKANVARTKATLIGAGLSKHEADMMNGAYRRDLQRFDKERVLVAWDALVEKQQTALETLGVPNMFATTSQADCQNQRKIVQVLEGL